MPEKFRPQEAKSTVSSDNAQIGVYICYCGGNISHVVQCEKVAKRIAQLPDVVVARTDMSLCSDAGQAMIEQDIRGSQEFQVDVRVLAATNREPREAVEKGKLREDLFYRLNVFTVTLPPLRERTSDIELLTQAFLVQFNEKHGRKIESCGSETMELLKTYPWPGNVRELRNVLERAVILTKGSRIEPSSLPEYVVIPTASEVGDALKISGGVTAAEAEKELILRTLKATGNNKAETARRLDLDVKTIRNKLKSYGIN